MEQCEFCGAILSTNASFCGNCGQAPHKTSNSYTYAGDRATVAIEHEGDELENAPTHLLQPDTMDEQLDEEDEEKKRRRLALFGLGLAGELAQPQGAQMPGITGSPQSGQMPGITGSPQSPGGITVANPLSNPGYFPPITYPPPGGGISGGGYPPPGGGAGGGFPGHKAPPGGSSGGLTGCVIAGAITLAAIILILTSIVTLGLTVWGPQIILNGNPNVEPGGTLILQGDNFLHNTTITLSLDNGQLDLSQQAYQPRLANGGDRNGVRASINGMLLTSLVAATSKSISSDNDGRFSITLNINFAWPAGQHMIQATEVLTHRSASLAFHINPSGATSTPTPTTITPTATISITPTSTTTVTPTQTPTLSCATPGALNLGPLSEDSSQTTQQTITLCASGSGTLSWSASWNDESHNTWLQLSLTSGSLQAPSQTTITVTASAAGLSAGIYSTAITFISLQSNTTQEVIVTLTVKAGCVSATPTSLNFTGVAGISNPGASQVISVTNCGLKSDWSAHATTDSGGNWLSIDQSSGTLDKGDTTKITVTAANLVANLSANAYQGTVTITIGSQTLPVDIEFTVLAAPKISASPTTMISSNCPFLSVHYTCTITLSNSSSSVALNWSASANLSGVTFQPSNSSYTIPAGGSETVTVLVSRGDGVCNSGLIMTFKGPANSVSVNWSCPQIQ